MAAKKVKVAGEYYAVEGLKEQRFPSPGEAVKAAMLYLIDSNANGVSVRRMTTHEPVAGPLGDAYSETMTGEVFVAGPSSYAYKTELSRYHAVNGWDVPDTIEVEEWAEDWMGVEGR